MSVSVTGGSGWVTMVPTKEAQLMSIMNTELYDALLSAGAGEEKARAATSAIGDVNQDINQDVNQLALKLTLRWPSQT